MSTSGYITTKCQQQMIIARGPKRLLLTEAMTEQLINETKTKAASNILVDWQDSNTAYEYQPTVHYH